MNRTRTIAWCCRGFACAATTLATVAFLAPAAGASSVTASSVIKAAQQAIAAQRSVHVEFVAHSSSPSRTERIVADVGLSSGKEAVSEGTAQAHLVFSTAVVYVSGNSGGLTTLFGLSSAGAKKVGGKWESWKPGSSQYDNLKADLTMSSVLALLPEAKGTKLSIGENSYVLKWTIRATTSTPALTNTLRLSAGPSTLPQSEYATASGGTKVTTTLSNWGEQVLVDVPPAASVIASSKVGS